MLNVSLFKNKKGVKMIAYFDYASTSFKKPKQVYKAIKLYKKSPVKNDNSSKNVKRFFKTFGSVLLLILECIWTIICTIFCINLISDIASGSKKKK